MINKFFRFIAILIGVGSGILLVFFIAEHLPYNRSGGSSRLHYDSELGWDSEISVSPLKHNTNNGPTVFFMGDSFTHGKLWPQIAQDEAEKKGLSFRGYSLGVDGYGTTQSYLKLKRYFDVYKPQIVILLFYVWNDPRDNYNNPPIYYGYGGTERPYIEKSSTGYRVVPLSFLHRSLMRLTHASYSPYFDRYHKKHAYSYKDPSSWLPFYLFSKQHDAYVEGSWDATEGAFTLMKNYLDKKAVPLVVLSIDNPFTVDKDVFDQHIKPKNLSDFSNELPSQRLAAILRKLDILHVDCIPALQEKYNIHNIKMFDGWRGSLSGHLQQEGEKILAKIAVANIFDSIGSEGK